jgi:tetratricopeptide (TPR) repeat protein/precorrin-6B methylase 2
MRVLRKLLSKSSRFVEGESSATYCEFGVTLPGAAIDVDQPVKVVSAIGQLVERGRYADALALADRALTTSPRDVELLFARAATLFSGGRYSEARGTLLNAERLGLRTSNLYCKLGWSCFWIARMDEALDWLQKAVVAAPVDWAAHFGLATVLRAKKQRDASRAAFERALQLSPDNLHCLSNLVACEIDSDRLDIAERYARRAIDLNPETSSSWSDLGMVLCTQDRFAEAIEAFEQAQRLPSTSEANGDYVNFAICLLRSARTQRALVLLEDTLPSRPSTTGHAQYALALLISGRLKEGWDQYEFRWIDPPLLSARPNFVKPAWTGQDLLGKTILIRTEQGIGDFIQFIRYAIHIKALGATTIVHLREETRELAEGVEGIDQIIGANEPYPLFDFYINLLTIPRIFATDLASIPADVPYIRIDRDRSREWAARLAQGVKLKVGLVWAGSATHLRDKFRSVSLSQLSRIREVGQVQLYSLQKGPAAAQLTDDGVDYGIVDLGPELHSFADTAAAICELDLVIGVDTAVVHLAGALGKPVWALIPMPADWRWLEGREDTPWYPTMRLFRQRDHGDWAHVIGRLLEALEAMVRDRGAQPSMARAAGVRVPLPMLKPAAWPISRSDRGLTRVTETRSGIMQYCLDLPDAGTSIEWYGEYLQQQIDLLSPLITPAMAVMEVGAGFGPHALWLATAIGPAGHLFLYEDDPRIRRVLQQNLRSNNMTNVTVMRGSLGITRAATVDPRYMGSSKATPVAGQRSETIDELRLEQLHWIKTNGDSDVLPVLQGAAETLWRLRPRLFLAAATDDMLERFTICVKDFGYSCWQVTTTAFNPDNFNQRDENIFQAQTALALLAIPEELGIQVVHPSCSRVT